MSLNPKHLIGGRIANVDMRPFVSGKGRLRRTCHDPIIELDDGSVLTFVVEETDSGERYGVNIVRTKR